MERRLAAILAADVVGYTRLMGEDEAGTLVALKAHREELIDPTVARRRGRLVKLMGDGALVEFASALDAVACAAEVQRGMADRNAEVPEAKRIVFRIGINLGDVIIEGDDLYGEGVNVAARLEGLAKPGGIYLSAKVHDEVRSKLDLAFEDLGRQQLKNIDEPVQVWGWVVDGPLTAGTAREMDGAPTQAQRGKPSIAVLPFDNMSGDPEQEYFSDGITEDVITELSRFRQLSVIARNSSFQYKGQSSNLQNVGQELQVEYVIEGSVRKAGNRVRVTAQLIEIASGSHIWAERYDRDLEDIFAVQDEIVQRIISSVAPGIVSAEMQRAQRKDVETLDAWDRIMRAHWHLARFTMEDNSEARRLLTEAAQIDPNSALALGDLAMIHTFDAIWNWGISRDQSLAAAGEAARRAVAIDENNAWGHIALGVVEAFLGHHDEAVRRLERAIEISPNDPNAHGQLGFALALSGDSNGAITRLEEAMRLSPRDPFLAFWIMSRAVAAYVAENHDETIQWCNKIIAENPRFPGAYRILAATYGELGETEQARMAIEELLRQMPGLTLAATREQVPWKMSEHAERYLDGLRKAGLPE
jgi:TolB-like protein/Flp pilus assembly protein TadD